MTRGLLPDSIARRLDPTARFGLRLTLFAIAIVLVAVPLLLLWIQVATEGPLTRVDAEVSEDLHGVVLRSEPLETSFRAITLLGDPAVLYAAAFVAAIFFWGRGSRRIALYLVATNLLGGVINSTIKTIVARARPAFEDPIGQASGYSFPSGHTLAATVGFGSLLLASMPLLPRRLRVPSIVAYAVLVALVATSRLALAVHYLSDVLAGFVLGVAWLAAATAAFAIWTTEHRPAGPETDALEKPGERPPGTPAPDRR